MSYRTRAVVEAPRAWNRTAQDLAAELLHARRALGARQKDVGAAIGISGAEVSRRERGRAGRVRGGDLAAHAAAVGLRLSLKLYPTGLGVRDAAQARYVSALIARLGNAWKVRLEAPIPAPGDLRAVDVLLIGTRLTIAVEVITRLSDIQAQVRGAQLKARDIGATRLVLAVAGSHGNRRELAAARGALIASFEMDSRRLWADLVAGRDPGRDAILVL